MAMVIVTSDQKLQNPSRKMSLRKLADLSNMQLVTFLWELDPFFFKWFFIILFVVMFSWVHMYINMSNCILLICAIYYVSIVPHQNVSKKEKQSGPKIFNSANMKDGRMDHNERFLRSLCFSEDVNMKIITLNIVKSNTYFKCNDSKK